MPDQQKNSLTPSEWFSSSSTFRFSVPVYQRLFTWETSQFDRLRDDLTDHFITNDSSDPYYSSNDHNSDGLISDDEFQDAMNDAIDDLLSLYGY